MWNENQKRGKMHSVHNTVELQVQLPHVDVMSRWHCCPERAMVSQSDWVSMGRLSLHLCLKCLLHAQVLEAWPSVLGHLYWEEGLWRWLAPEGLISGVCCPIHRPTALETIRNQEILWKRFYWRQQVIRVLPLETIFSPDFSTPPFSLPPGHCIRGSFPPQLTLQLILSLSGWPNHTEAEWPWTDRSETVSQNKPCKLTFPCILPQHWKAVESWTIDIFDGLFLYLVISPSGLSVTARKWVYLIHPQLWCLQRQDLQDTAFIWFWHLLPCAMYFVLLQRHTLLVTLFCD